MKIVIKYINSPEKSGTLVIKKSCRIDKVVKSVTYNRDIAVLKIQGTGVGHKPGIIGDIGKRLSQIGVNIYSVITSQTCINLLINPDDSENSLACVV
jgi:aspartokinase